MSRIQTPASIEAAPEKSQELLHRVQTKFGAVPNMFRLFSNSPVALEGLLGLWGALGKSGLGRELEESIALAVANVNGCSYCNSAHSYLGEKVAKLSADEIALNQDGHSGNPKRNAALQFARRIAETRGATTEKDLERVRRAGYTDAELIEIVGFVALNVFTNYVNEVFATDVDFPLAAARRAA